MLTSIWSASLLSANHVSVDNVDKYEQGVIAQNVVSKILLGNDAME